MKRLAFVLVPLLLLGLYATVSSGTRVLKVNTGGSLLGGEAIEAVTRAFEKDTGIKVEAKVGPTGQCGFTVKNLVSGNIDIGVMCCPVNKLEAGAKDLVQVPVARGAWVFTVSKSNPVDSLSTQQMRDIYQGRITNWSEVGGKNAPIQPYAYIMCGPRDESLRQFLVGENQYKKGIVGIDNRKFASHVKKAKPGNKENCTLAESDPNAIVGLPFHSVAGSKPGCSAMRKGTVKMMAVDNIMPKPETITNASYPVYNDIFMITKGVPDRAEAQYLSFIRSDKGQRLLASNGLVAPLP